MFIKRPATAFAVLAVIGVVIASFVFGVAVGMNASEGSGKYELLEEVQDHLRTSAARQPTNTTLLRGAAKGMLESLDDPYAAFLDPATYDSFRQEVNAGVFSGVGLWLRKQEDGRVKVVRVLAGTPASRAGILDEDVILKVGTRLAERLALDELIARIQGRPGTNVSLTILREPDITQEFTLTRERIAIPIVSSRKVNNQIALIEVVEFAGGAGDQVRRMAEQLAPQARGFILDLRGNPGGSTDEAIKVASVFLSDGVVMTERRRSQRSIEYRTQGGQEVPDEMPLVVLVDEGSASASEIVAGAIQDRGRGVILGTHTYGKGSIQSVFPLTDGSAIKFTTASFHTPSGTAIGDQGLSPDVLVEAKADQLPRAQEVLTKMLAEPPRRRR